MADLLDIAPSTAVETVTIGHHSIEVQGLHGDAIASIASRFPTLVMLLAGGENVVARLIGQFGFAIGPIIAAGCGHPGDEKYEHHANLLSAEDQFRLVMVIYRLTFPNGLAALIKMITSGAAGEKTEVARIRLKKSPSASPPLSDAASLPTMQ